MSENNRSDDERLEQYLRGFRGPAPRASVMFHNLGNLFGLKGIHLLVEDEYHETCM